MDFTARGVLGVRLPKDALYRKSKQRGCKHAEVDAKFCNECGKPMWLEVKATGPNYNEVKDTFAGLSIYRFSYDDSDMVVGHDECAIDSSYRTTSFIPLGGGDAMPIVGVYEQCKRALEPLGLWKPDQFGFHVIVSY